MGKAYSEAEYKILAQMHGEGKSTREIAEELRNQGMEERSEHSIRHQLRKLKGKEDEREATPEPGWLAKFRRKGGKTAKAPEDVFEDAPGRTSTGEVKPLIKGKIRLMFVVESRHFRGCAVEAASPEEALATAQARIGLSRIGEIGPPESYEGHTLVIYAGEDGDIRIEALNPISAEEAYRQTAEQEAID